MVARLGLLVLGLSETDEDAFDAGEINHVQVVDQKVVIR